MGNSYILKNEERYEYDDWKKDYTGYLENLYELPRNPYNDPDAIATKNEAFYGDLAEFLDKREQSREMRDKLKGEWTYKAVSGKAADDYGIQVSENGDKLFVLFSDQFGFSAPDLKRNHPYDTYVKLARAEGEERYNEAISNVVEWIFNTRSIGGSFLWPRQIQKYNYVRGGTESYSSYIQDRVDLTLLEIKHIYDEPKTESDILYPYYEKSDDLKKFFGHFGKFDTYVKFFEMEDFVENGIPIDIITGKPLTDEDIKEYRNKKAGIFDLKIDKIEQMLRRVRDLIVARSSKMQG